MASLPFLLKPLSPNLVFFTKCSDYSQNPSQFGTSFRKSKNVRSSSIADSSGQTADVPLLTSSEAMERLRNYRNIYGGKQQYLAMYSSVLGGITTDPAAMVIPMDDHMVHRGHGVFDTAAIVDGHLYELDQHLDRILRSAKKAKIGSPFDRDTIKRILLQTVSSSKCRTGSLRYWISAGPGDFQLSPANCHRPALYAVVIKDQYPYKPRGIKVITSSIPIKPPEFATTKSVNYLPNVLSKMEAEETVHTQPFGWTVEGVAEARAILNSV